MTDHNKTVYYSAKRTRLGYVGRLYRYDVTGNHELDIWLSSRMYLTQEEAEEAAVEEADARDITAELG